jgi:flagellar biosynthesis/type III secretory pathway M-ring protein FliF/YscJ
MDKLRRIVTSALGADTTRGDTVALEEMPFNDTFANEMTQQLDSQQKKDFYMNLVGNLAYPALGLVSIFILFRMFKRAPVHDIPLGVPVGQLGYKTGTSHAQTEPGVEAQPGVVTVDVLNRLIRENPNNMTAAIRDWMSRGVKPE